MPKGYVIAHAVVTDAEKWGQYVAKSKIALDKFEGKPIVRGGNCEIVEGNGTQRNVVLGFRVMSMRSATPRARNMPRPGAAPGRRHHRHHHCGRRLTPVG